MYIDYFWIENFGIIKGQGYNFNPNTRYQFDSATRLLHRQNHHIVPDDFFSIKENTVSGISALVGANGTGKSTFMRALSTFLCGGVHLNGIMVTGDAVYNKTSEPIYLGDGWGDNPLPVFDRVKIANHGKSKYSKKATRGNEHPRDLLILGKLVTDTIIINFAGEINLDLMEVMYQSIMTLADELGNTCYVDVSDIAMMKVDQATYRTDKIVYSGENAIMVFRSGEAKRFMDFMNSGYSDMIPFPYNNLTLRFKYNEISKTFLQSYDEMAFKSLISAMDHDQLNETWKPYMELLESEGFGVFLEARLDKAIMSNEETASRLKFYHALVERHFRELVMETLGEMTNSDKLGAVAALLHQFATAFFNEKPYLEQVRIYLRTYNSVNHHQSVGRLNFSEAERFITGALEIGTWDGSHFNFDFANPEKFRDFVRLQSRFGKKSGFNFDVLTIFDMEVKGLSTGEKQFLKLFSRLYGSIVTEYLQNPKIGTILFLLDEFDIGFHPIWQKKFLDVLINYLEHYLASYNPNLKVQVFLASHSPFVVSDLPKECVNFIAKQEGTSHIFIDDLKSHGKTFGANIHDLYTDSFFMNGAHLGNWAKQKIDKLFKELTSEDAIIDEAKTAATINLIGEPLIRMKLLELFASKTKANVVLARLRLQQELIAQKIKSLENDPN